MLPTNPLGASPTFRSYAPTGPLGAVANVAADLGGPARMIRVGQAGNLEITDSTGARGIIYNVQVGEPQLVYALMIHFEGTTAQKITAFL